MNFTQTKRTPYIAIIHTDKERTAYLTRAGVQPEGHDVARKLFKALKGLTITNSSTGEYCIARDVPPMLTEQAI